MVRNRFQVKILAVAVAFLALGSSLAQESLRKGDALNIAVFGEESLTGVFGVSEGGEIRFPLLGRLKVAGQTPQVVEEEIERLLEIDLIRDAEVSVSLTDREALAVNVIGDVRSPGRVQFPEGGSLDLMTAIASAGGLTATSDPNRVLLRRSGQSNGETVSGAIGRRSLRPGDTVIVSSMAKAETITITGNVKSPGSIELPPSGEIDLLTAIARTGGFTSNARPSKVTVRRKSSSGTTGAITVNAAKLQTQDGEPFLLQAGDSVFVPESIF